MSEGKTCMNQNIVPLEAGWRFPGLKPYRSCDATYCFYPYESLPSLPASIFQGTFDWLTPLEHYQDIIGMDHYHTEDDLSQVIESSLRLQIALPDPFLRFMALPNLLERIPSCTDAFFSLSDMVPYTGPGGGYIVRFMNARQGQIAWYLYLNLRGEHCVLVGFPLLDVLHDPESPDYMKEQITEKEQTMVLEGRGATICAFSFEEFVYRFWIENTIWYKLSGYSQWKPLTRDEHLYLADYKRKKGSLRPQE